MHYLSILVRRWGKPFMKILVINCGSSSLKYKLIEMQDETVLAKGNCERIGAGGHVKCKANGTTVSYDCELQNHAAAFEKVSELLMNGDTKVIDSPDDIAAIGHRVVQGGDIFHKSVLVDEKVKDGIRSLIDLAPLHNSANLQGIECAEAAFPGKPNVCVFDNAFHSTMPPRAYMYPLPYRYYQDYKVRKYGFHGTSHRYISVRLHGMHPEYRKIIICHIGNGSSVSAIKDGEVMDTSMGMTPLDGFIMGTRCGSIDPAIVTYIQEKEGVSPERMNEIMNKESGLLGLSGVSSDMRDLRKAANAGNERAQLALDVLYYQVAQQIGAYMVSLGGFDALVFTAGIGENTPMTRKIVCDFFKFFGMKLDPKKNEAAIGKEMRISTDDSSVAVYVIPTDEELMIARDTKALIRR